MVPIPLVVIFILFLLCASTFTMPIRKNISYKKRRPSSTKYQKRYSYKAKIPQGLSAIKVPGKTVLPQKLQTQFRMNFRLNLEYTASTGIPNSFNLIANSLYDALGASGTTQPPMFDEMMAFYQRYEVRSCKIDITYTNTTDAGAIVYISPISDTSDTYSFDVASVMPGAKCTTIGPLSGARAQVSLSNYGVTRNILGVQDDTNYQGSATSNPTRQWNWHLSSAPTYPGLASDYVINMWIRLTFYVLLSDPSVVANS